MPTALPPTNLCVLSGTLTRPPEVRTLPSGDTLAALDLRIDRPDGPTETVPVVHPSPPSSVLSLEPGAIVVVRGRVRRRFFRAGGVTQSRTEVVADQIVVARQRARVARLLAVAASALPTP